MRLKIFVSAIHGQSVVRVCKSLSLHQHGTLKKNGTWKTLAELKAEKSQTEPANGPTTTGGDADGF